MLCFLLCVFVVVVVVFISAVEGKVIVIHFAEEDSGAQCLELNSS